MIINEIKTTASNRVVATTTTTTTLSGTTILTIPTTKIPDIEIDTPPPQLSSVPTRLKQQQQNGSLSKFLLNDSNSFNNTTTNTDILSISSSSSVATHNAYLNSHNSHGAGSTSGISSYISDISGVDLSMDSVVERFNEE